MEIFTIPHEGRHILYFPFRNAVFAGNAALVNLARRAQQGQASAVRQLRDMLGDKLWIDDPRETALRSRALPEPFRPTSISLLLTDDCTLRCRYCYADGGKSRQAISWDTVAGVIDVIFANAAAIGCEDVAVNFHGGDVGAVWPLFVRTRGYMRDKEKSLGIRAATSVGTNGVLDDAQRLWLTENIDSATLSVDGPPAIHDSARAFPDGSPSSNFVLKTMQHFDRVKFPYGIRSTVTGENVSRMDECVGYICANSAAKRIQMEPMYPQGRAANGNVSPPSARAFIDNFRTARKVASSFGRRLCYSGARLDVLTNVFCRACGDSCVVTPSGDITSCYEVADAANPLAGVFFYGRYDPKTRTFVLDRDRRERLFGLSVLEKPECSDCFCKWHCAGDCPAKALLSERAEIDNLPDRCLINRELTRDQLVAALGVAAEVDSSILGTAVSPR